MVTHLPELWHKDIGHFSNAIRARELPPTILEARADQSVDGTPILDVKPVLDRRLDR